MQVLVLVNGHAAFCKNIIIHRRRSHENFDMYVCAYKRDALLDHRKLVKYFIETRKSYIGEQHHLLPVTM